MKQRSVNRLSLRLQPSCHRRSRPFRRRLPWLWKPTSRQHQKSLSSAFSCACGDSCSAVWVSNLHPRSSSENRFREDAMRRPGAIDTRLATAETAIATVNAHHETAIVQGLSAIAVDLRVGMRNDPIVNHESKRSSSRNVLRLTDALRSRRERKHISNHPHRLRLGRVQKAPALRAKARRELIAGTGVIEAIAAEEVDVGGDAAGVVAGAKKEWPRLPVTKVRHRQVHRRRPHPARVRTRVLANASLVSRAGAVTVPRAMQNRGESLRRRVSMHRGAIRKTRRARARPQPHPRKTLLLAANRRHHNRRRMLRRSSPCGPRVRLVAAAPGGTVPEARVGARNREKRLAVSG
jgi:hypothetical protein